MKKNIVISFLSVALVASVALNIYLLKSNTEVKNKEQEETMREVGHLLLEVKCLARLGALASDSCIIDDELQLQDNIEYYFALRQVANLIAKIEHLLFD